MSHSTPPGQTPSKQGAPTSKTIVIGLTGGIASGKSTVGKLLAEMGCTVTDADRLVAELYEPGGQGAQAVSTLFGEDMLDPSGAVDKEKLGPLVFADDAARKRLEQVIHPLVGQAFAELVQRSKGLVVFEATLMAETGGHERYPLVITVEANEERRLDRAVERGLDRESAKARMAAQATRAEREAIADIVIVNDGSLDDLRVQVVQTLTKLREQLEL